MLHFNGYTDAFVATINVPTTFRLLDGLKLCYLLDPGCPAQVRDAADAVEGVLGAAFSRGIPSHTRGEPLVIEAPVIFDNAVDAYQDAINCLTNAFAWVRDTSGGVGYNRWNDLSHKLHLRLAAIHHENQRVRQ